MMYSVVLFNVHYICYNTVCSEILISYSVFTGMK